MEVEENFTQGLSAFLLFFLVTKIPFKAPLTSIFMPASLNSFDSSSFSQGCLLLMCQEGPEKGFSCFPRRNWKFL